MKFGRVVAAVSETVSASLPSIPHRADINLTLSANRFARLAPGAVTLTADSSTTLLATAVPSSGHFFVDYRSRAAALGVIPNTFPRRELAPAPAETVTTRLVDRSLRPVLGHAAPLALTLRLLASERPSALCVDALAVNAASAAAAAASAEDGATDAVGLVGAARVAVVDGRIVSFPSLFERAQADFSLFVSTRMGRVLTMMVESGSGPVEDARVMELLGEGIIVAEAMVPLQRELVEKVLHCRVKEGRSFHPRIMPTEAKIEGDEVVEGMSDAERADVKEFASQVYEEAFVECRAYPGKAHRADVVTRAQQKIVDHFPLIAMGDVLGIAQATSREVHRTVLLRDSKRIDGRGFSDIRPVRCETAVLSGAVHGSAVFERGDTQVLACATVGLPRFAQRIADNVDTASGVEDSKPFFLHYSFPGYATGEQDKFGGSGNGGSRREVGHGILAESSLRPLIGPADGTPLPYVSRVSAEVLASDGSSSMATVCAGSLALMDAGVQLREPVAGVAMGLIPGDEGGDDTILTDILGAEDHFGWLDCKVSGTKNGVTASQLDVKSADGISVATVGRVFKEAGVARSKILDEMKGAIDESRPSLPRNAPRSVTMPVDLMVVVKVLLRDRAVGLKEIESKSGTRLSVENEKGMSQMRIDAPSAEAATMAIALVEEALADMAVGAKVRGRVVETRHAFALVEVDGVSSKGMLHVSKMNLPRGGEGDGKQTPDAMRYPDVRNVLGVGEHVDLICLESCREKNVLRFGMARKSGDDYLEGLVFSDKLEMKKTEIRPRRDKRRLR